MLFILTMSMLFCYLFQFYRGKNEQQRVAQKFFLICGLYGMSRMGKCIFLRVGCLFLLWFPMVGCQCRYWRCCKKPVSCNYYNGHPVSLMGRGSTFLSWNKKQSKHAWIELFQTFSCLILIVCSGGDWVLCAKESSGIKTSYLISSGMNRPGNPGD